MTAVRKPAPRKKVAAKPKAHARAKSQAKGKTTPEEAARPRLRRRLALGVLSTLVFLGLMAGVVPVRQYLEQQRRLDAARQRIELLDEENRRLAARAGELRTDEEIERLAREQYSLVRPGEEAFALLPGSDEKRPAQAPLKPTTPIKPPEPSWLEKALDTVAFWD